jgi:glyoxylase-like metal-dependent hydrolase (beta-lactamase superfamily II)
MRPVVIVCYLAFWIASLGAQESGALIVEPVRDNIYLLAGAGANITVSAGEDGVVVVDAGGTQRSADVIPAVQRVFRDVLWKQGPSDRDAAARFRLRYVLTTSGLPEHAGGIAAVAASQPVVVAHENVLARLSDEGVPTAGLPTLTYFGSIMKVSQWLNGEGIELLHLPDAITDGDSVVHFRRADVISTGAIFDITQYPVIDLAKGGSIQGEVAALNRLLDVVIADAGSEGGTLIVPAHGRICDVGELSNYRNMITIVRDRVDDMVKKKMTLAQVKSAKPTEDWDARFGRNAKWTPDMFVEAVYGSLVKGDARAAK